MYTSPPKARFVSSVGNGLFNSASLNLDFAKTKSLVDAITGQNLVTFTRASSATYTDSAGVLRSAVTNLLLRSEEFNDASWTKSNSSITANASVAPNGTLTSDKIIEAAAVGTKSIRQIANTTVAIIHTASCYLKASERSICAFEIVDNGATGNGFSGYFNLSTGASSNVASFGNGSGATASIAPVGDGWYRCSLTGIANTSGTALRFNVYMAVTAGSVSYTGDGTSGLFLWGAQLEQSATVGEYIPTTSTINSAPRFDHNPTTGESLGLLVEEARTNLVIRSEEFGDIIWTTSAVTVTSNTGTAPDGLSTADTITSSGTAVVSQAVVKAASAITYTGSLFVKGTVTAFSFSIDDGATVNRGRVVFNLSTGTVSSTNNDGSFTGTSGTITLFPNGWYRLTVTTTTNSSTLVARLRPFWTGAGTSIDFWGAQLETGAFPTSYIPTTTATVTRAADVASITGSNFSSWYNQTEGTVFSEYFPNAVAAVASGQTLFYISNNSTTDRNFVGKRANADQSTRWSSNKTGAVDTAFINAGTWLAANSKIATVYKVNDYAASLNGATASSDSSVDLFTGMTQINFGSFNDESANLNGTIKRLTYWPVRLANTTLQQITQP